MSRRSCRKKFDFFWDSKSAPLDGEESKVAEFLARKLPRPATEKRLAYRAPSSRPVSAHYSRSRIFSTSSNCSCYGGGWWAE